MFIGRRADGTIYGAWAVRQPDDGNHPNQEQVADDLPELVAYIASLPTTPKPPPDKDAECRKALDADPAAGIPNVDLWKVVRAKAISDLAFRLGVAPGTLTLAQIAAERNRIAAIYAAL